MSILDTIHNYEEYVYTLQQKFPQIKISTLVVKPLGAQLAGVSGAVTFEKNIRLFVRERLNFEESFIKGYSYEVIQDETTLYWYDSQPHPDEPGLSDTHPHHKHIPPGIKRHRISAPGLNFNSPNLHFLIQEIIDTLL